MSVYSQKRVIKLCAQRGRHNCMTTLPICGSMLTSVVFDPALILSRFGSLVLSGPDIPSECFEDYHR